MPNSFAKNIIPWYKNHYRDLPWRQTKDPYKIWLSEIILQQTRVAQGLPYYLNFVEQYPTVFELARASEDEVLRMWQGLGYYSRARNLHACAKMVVEEYQGKFPDTYEALQQLKGVGKYTAAAIASFAFKRVVPVVDGNVFRVLSRYLLINNDIADPKNFKIFFNASEKLIAKENPDLYNQAIMELGATICSVSKPACLICPVTDTCMAREKGAQNELPVKKKKVKVRNRFFYYLVIEKNDKLLMGKRGPKDIWQGLFDFPLIERDRLLNEEEIAQAVHEFMGSEKSTYFEVSDSIKHVLTHQRLQAFFITLKTDEPITLTDYDWHTKAAIETLPKPILVDKYLKETYN